MKVGDLVIPKMTCAGVIGSERCKTALVKDCLQTSASLDNQAKILWRCGVSGWFNQRMFELIGKRLTGSQKNDYMGA